MPDGVSTHGRPGVARHRRRAALPRGSLIRVAPNVLVTGPELTLCQLAVRGDYDLVDVAKLAFELCGTYLLDQAPNSWQGFVNNEVSATTVSLHRCGCSLAQGLEGRCENQIDASLRA